MKTDNRLGVVGAGTMGAGIAQTAAAAGFNVLMLDRKTALLDRAVAKIHQDLDRGVEKGRLTPEKTARVKAALKTSTNLADLAGHRFVVEAVYEDRAAKKEVYKALADILPPDALMGSNTSSISITELAAAWVKPENFVGIHFFNPVPRMKLVEVIRGLQTSEEAVNTVIVTVDRLGKTPVKVNDRPGFVANRLLMPMINEAVYALDEAVADARSIDDVMKLGCNFPMGPLELADLIGLDVCLNILEVLHEDFGDPKYRPCPLLRNMVRAGRLGRKTGAGFFEYR